MSQSVKDDHGKYESVQIGSQLWMAKNLNIDRLRNGDIIPEAKTAKEWEMAVQKRKPAWCYYNNDPANGKKYGRLYNWYAINDPRGLAPEGWHIPTEAEFQKLSENINVLKATGHGTGPRTGTNETGLSALLAGGHFYSSYFNDLAYYTSNLNSTEYDTANASNAGLGSDLGCYYNIMSFGFSIRCLEDESV